MTSIVADHICKSYSGKQVLKDLSFSLPSGQITAVMAPSGAGKTTLLRLLLGLEEADSGSVRGLDGLRLSAVFQEDRLCENLSAFSNIRLVTGRQLSRQAILDALNALGLSADALKPVRELSGGQRRRAALLRALLAPWDFLLLDEPFKGLDAETRRTAMDYVRFCFGRRSDACALLVTHDRTEADYLADQIISI